MNAKFLACIYILLAVASANAQQGSKTKYIADPEQRGRTCDSGSFIEYAQEAEKLRVKRRLSASEFAKYAKAPNTIVLDARGKEAYQLLHIKGSINLPYTSMGEASLKEAIPDKSTRILIYCRNNLVEKPADQKANAAGQSQSVQHPYPSVNTGKAARAGLNIPTYITLFIYGYQNVWELDPAVDPNNSPIEFESEKPQS